MTEIRALDELLGHAESRLAAQCFSVPYQGHAHEELYRRVRELRRKVRQALHYSVYAAFVQTSGFGKTRAVLEMACLGVYICYCSLAAKGSSAFPPRTELLADRLSQAASEIEMVLYLKAWLLVLYEELQRGVTAQQWKDMQLPGGENLAKRVHQVWSDLLDKPNEEEWMVLDDPDKANAAMLEDAVSRINGMFPPSASRPRVIFVFDEARGLQDDAELGKAPFNQIRRALRVFFNHRRFFALMLDTASKICKDLLPRRSEEDSARALKLALGLLPPIYFIPTLSVNKVVAGKTKEEYVNPFTWMTYGRPMWAARLAVEKDTARLQEFAVQKLVGVVRGEFHGTQVNVAEGEMTESQAIAMLTACAGLQVCARSPLAEVMAASHMNLVLRVAKDPSRIFVGLPVEPILAEAAAGLLRDDIVKQKALMHVESACMSGYVTPGPRGEFVAKFILVAASWALADDNLDEHYLRPVPVANYVRKLLVNGRADHASFRELERNLPAGGLVFFNAFVAVNTVPDEAMLGKCCASGCAIMYSADNNLPGADAIIPVWTPQAMTCIVISVKNLQRAGWLEKASVDKVKCEFTRVEVAQGLPVLTVAMSLREPSMQDSTNWILWDDLPDMHSHVTCYGIQHNYDYLSTEVKQLLQSILVTVPDPMHGANKEEAEWIKQMLPERFEKAERLFRRWN
ncbi:hypothetical protein SELMODRAFT_412629 [Selaginella moellendorffii]|uniref:Uncharacterized protein n=1 Tax=Selaginella moellendorffii TaxID=88036 RepID=D8RM42_SELML|nr:hypothetical protein SELMODRAFT_412629 [Selaginella moellendorffii]